jgi:hypothetical protein
MPKKGKGHKLARAEFIDFLRSGVARAYLGSNVQPYRVKTLVTLLRARLSHSTVTITIAPGDGSDFYAVDISVDGGMQESTMRMEVMTTINEVLRPRYTGTATTDSAYVDIIYSGDRYIATAVWVKVTGGNPIVKDRDKELPAGVIEIGMSNRGDRRYVVFTVNDPHGDAVLTHLSREACAYYGLRLDGSNTIGQDAERVQLIGYLRHHSAS